MALVRTNRIGSQSATALGAGSYTTAAFTPSNNSLLVAVVVGISGGAVTGSNLTIADSLGLTWAPQLTVDDSWPGNQASARVWTTEIVTGASMTVTFDVGAETVDQFTVFLFDETGYNAASPIGATASNTNAGTDGALTITLSSAPASDSEVVAVLGRDDNNAVSSTPGAGWTEQWDLDTAGHSGAQLQTRTGSTSTSVDWADLDTAGSVNLGHSIAFAFEIRAAAVPTKPVYGGQTSQGFRDLAGLGAGGATTPLNLTGPVVSGLNTFMLCYCSTNGDGQAPSGATYNGVSLGTPLADLAFNGSTSRHTVWGVVAPASAATFSVTFPAAVTENAVLGAIYWTNVNQTTPTRTATTASGTTNPATASVTNSVVNDLIAEIFGLDNTLNVDGMTSARVGAGQTFRVQISNSTGEANASVSEEDGAAGTVTASWDFTDNANSGWALAAIPLIVASVTTSAVTGVVRLENGSEILQEATTSGPILVHTDRGDTQTTAGVSATNTVAAASFTPAAGALITVSVAGLFNDGGSGATTFSITNTGFTVNSWAEKGTRVLGSGGGYSMRVSEFYATVTSSAAGVITCTRTAGNIDQWMVIQVDEWTNHNGVGQFASNDDGLASGSTLTVTFASTPAALSGAVGILLDNNGSTTGAVQPTGWTESADIGAVAVGNSLDAAWINGSVPQANQWTALQSATFGKIACTLEVLASSFILKPLLHFVLESGVAGSWTGSGSALTENGFQILLEDGTSKVLFEAADLTALVQEAGRYWLTEANDHVLLEGSSAGAFRAISDTASGVDTIARGLVLARSLTDTAAGSDALTRTLVQTRAITDIASGTDAVARSRASTRSITDTAAGTDVVTRAVVEARSITDVAAGSDVVTRARVSTRSITDTAAGSDATTRSLVQSRALTDSAPASDVAATPTTTRPITDTAAGTDAITRTASFPRIITDTAAGTDAVTRTSVRSRSITDTAVGTDTVTRSLTGTRSVTDTAAGTDVVTRSLIDARSITDAAGGTDALTRAFINTRAITDVASGTDAVSRSLIDTRSISDVAAGTDAITRTRVSTRAITDSASASDAVVRTSAFTRTLADIGAGSDVVTRTDVYARSISDAAGGTDAVTRTRSSTRALSDTANGADSVTARSLVFARSISDSAPTSETLVSSKGPTRFINDNAPAVDTVTRTSTRSRAIADSAVGADAAAPTVSRIRAVSDTASGTDSITRALARSRALSDSAPATDTIVRSRSSVRAISDSAFAGDTVTRTVQLARSFTDVAHATDVAVSGRLFSVFITDAAGGSDSAVAVVVRTIVTIRFIQRMASNRSSMVSGTSRMGRQINQTSDYTAGD